MNVSGHTTRRVRVARSWLAVATIVCTASDVAGNSAQSSVGYTVGYAFGGFLEPIPQSSYVAGSTIPVNFTLRDHTGAVISDGDARALTAGCLVRIRLDGVVQPRCATYDARTDQFAYSLKTPKGMSGPHVATVAVAAPNGSGTINMKSVTVTLRR